MKRPWTRVLGPDAFAERVHAIVGLPVSTAWRGHGSALFLELGELRAAAPRLDLRRPARQQGEAGVMIEWSWRIERPRSIAVGSGSTDARINAGIRRLAGHRVVSVTVEGRLPELAITLSDGRWVRSFMTAEGQPQWTVFLPDGSWLTVERGRIIHDVQNGIQSANGAARGA